jgi:sugar phosphate isomerase/epimerase
MKIGFSSLVCPAWDLETIVARAAEWGYNGVELRGLRGELHLPLVPELAGRPDDVRALCRDKGVELVCLGASATLDSKKDRVRAQQKQALTEFIELAGRLGCPHVRILVGEVQRWDNARAALGRVAEGLISLVPVAARNHVTLLVENGGDFLGSEHLWYLVDAVNHPAVLCCWNQCHARTILERPTISIPRLGRRIGLVHLCDARYDEQGILLEYKPLGEGQAEIAKQIELLKGIAYDGYLIFEWPKLWLDSLPAPEDVLPKAAQFLQERLAEKQPVLSAYKGDKNAPKFTQREAGASFGSR